MRTFFARPSPGSLQSLFLQCQGLREPLTAIRWGASRLRNAKKWDLSAEDQKDLLDNVYDNAKLLSLIVDAMMLLAELDEGAKRSESHDVCIGELLKGIADEFGHPEGKHVITSPHLHVSADIHALEATIRILLALRSEPTQDPMNIMIHAETVGRTLRITFFASLRFPVLLESGRPSQMGGTTGLLLSLAKSLAASMGAAVLLERKVDGNFVPFDASSPEHSIDLTSKHVKIMLNVPTEVREWHHSCQPFASVEGVLAEMKQLEQIRM
jgi:hypothetical protein